MKLSKFLAAMSQDLTIQQLEDCGFIKFIKTGIICHKERPLNDTLTVIIANIEILIESHATLKGIWEGFGICCNYSHKFMTVDGKNNDFYSVNWFLSTAIDANLFPIPFIGSWDASLWEDDNLKHRIMYMQWVIRQLKTLKSYLDIE